MKFDDNLLLNIRQGNNDEVKTILEELNPSVSIDDSRTTLLHVAADCGNETITEYLIARGCKIDSVDDLGNTPLILASKANHINVIRLLLEANASVLICNHQDENVAQIYLGNTRSSPLNYNIINLIVKKVKEECSNDSLQTAKELLKAGCSLFRAVKLKDVIVTEYMLQNGCNANDRCSLGPYSTALHEAVLLSDLENVKLLISYEADVNARDMHGMRPINLEFNRNKQILKVLIDNGAQWITDDGILVKGVIFHYEEFLYLLKQPNLNLSFIRDDLGWSLFSWLLGNKNFDIIGKLLRDNMDDSFDVNDISSGSTLLMGATWHGNLDAVEFLLNKGANVNVVDTTRDEVESTALTRALREIEDETEREDRMKILILLLQYGADVQWISSENLTVFDEALNNENFAMAECILAHLAVMEELGCQIKDLIRDKINSCERFNSHYDHCKGTIDSWKQMVINDRVNLFEFMTVNEKMLVNFARSEEFVSEIQLIMQRESGSNFYYSEVLQKRVSKAVEIVNLQRHAFNMVSQICQLQNNEIITRKIVGYLNYDKLQVIGSRPTNLWYKTETSI